VLRRLVVQYDYAPLRTTTEELSVRIFSLCTLPIALGVCLASCGSSTPKSAASCPDVAKDATFPCDPTPDAVAASSLSCFVARLPHGTDFDPLSPPQLDAAGRAARALVDNDLPSARDRANAVGYQVVRLRTPTECYWALTPPSGAPRGQATLVVRDAWARDLVIEAPHVPFDGNTDAESALVFESTRARALLVAGAQRCASTEKSGCNANSQCGSSAKESDPSHSVHTAFHGMHVGIATAPQTTVAVQFHTNVGLSLNGNILVSNGTRNPSPRSQKLFDALVARGVDPKTCNDPAKPVGDGAYCGTTSAQALASNGVADACGGSATSTSDHFLHLEQNSRKLDDVAGWSASVGQAISDAFPPRTP
jgi:hypothetical protein